MAYHAVAVTLTTVLAISSAYPLAALSALLGGNGLATNLNSNFNNFDGNPTAQQQQKQQQQQQEQQLISRENPAQATEEVQPVNLCPCSQPRTEIFVTETPRGSEIIAAETSNGNGVSLATINDEYTKQEPEVRSQESTGDRSSQLSTLPARVSVSPLMTDQSAPVYPSRSYAGSISGALSGIGNLGHTMSASGSLAGNLGYSGSMSGAGIGSGHGLGHASSMASSMIGPHGSMAGSLAGSHGMNGGSLAGSMAGSHHGGSMAGSLAGSNHISGGNIAGSVAGNNQNTAGGYVNRTAAGHETSSAIVQTNENPNDPRGNENGDIRNNENLAGGTDRSNSAGSLAGGVAGRKSHRGLAGSLSGTTHENRGGVVAGSMASATGSGQAQAGSMAGAQSNGGQRGGGGGGSAMSGSLAGSHNGIAQAVSTTIAGYHQKNDNALPQQQTEQSQQPKAIRRSFNGNENVNRNFNYNRNSLHV